MKKNKDFSLIYFIIFSLFLSIILFRGRLGSDDLEVFNFVYNYSLFKGNLIEYLEILKNEQGKLFYSENQKHTYYTFHHRIIWVIQTFVIFNLTEFLLSLFNYNSLFLLQYLSGFILTFYTILSLYFCNLFLRKQKMENNLSILLTLIIFLSTGLISLFTGQYIESLAVLILSIRLNTKNEIFLFILDFCLILVKPFYFVIIFVLRVLKIEKNIFYFSNYNFKIYLNILILFLLYLLLRYVLVGIEGNLNYFKSQDPTFDLLKYVTNFYNFYFSLGTGIFFTSSIPLLLIFFGKDKKTIFKIISILPLSLVLSFFEGFHGCVPGIRYFLPFLIIFFPEYKSGMEKIINKKKLFILIILVTFFNLPTLEYRNFHITEYLNGTVYTNKNLGVAKIVNNNYILFNWPIHSVKFNNIVFSNIVLINKFLDQDEFKIKDLNLKLKNIYPQTGLARLIFIKQNNIKLQNESIKAVSSKFYKMFLLLYYFFIFVFFTYFFYLYVLYNKKNN